MILHRPQFYIKKSNMYDIYHWLSLRSSYRGHLFSSICSSFGFGLLSQMCIHKHIHAYIYFPCDIWGGQMPPLAVGVSHVLLSKIVLLWLLATIIGSRLGTWPNLGQQNRRSHLWLCFFFITSPNWMQHSQSICRYPHTETRAALV